MSGTVGQLKSSLRSTFILVGLDVRRKRAFEPTEPPPLYDDPLEALYLSTQHDLPAAFKCPIEAIVDPKGFGFGKEAWHPFVAATQELERGGEAAAEALLERFYTEFRPQSAAEAYLGFSKAPTFLAGLAPHLYLLAPWTIETPEQMLSLVEEFIQSDNREHGGGGLTLFKDGHPMIGPVTPEKRKLELQRLAHLYRSMKQSGYDRTMGDSRYIMLRRGRDCRYIPFGGGYHRASVRAAQGVDWVPGQFYPRRAFVDVADVDYWPQVRRSLWSRSQALAYVD